MNIRRGFSAIAIAMGCALVLTSCGQTSQKYASDSKDGVFFAVPNFWNLISEKDLIARESLSTVAGAADRLASVHWQLAFSPDKKIMAKDVLNLNAPSQPIIYARVRSLTNSEIQSVSYNELRDLVVPLTSWEDGSAASIPQFNVMTDEESIQKGGRGVHSIFSFVNNGVDQTIDQTGLISNNHRTLVILIARCTTACYKKSKAEIDRAVASFTDRGTK